MRISGTVFFLLVLFSVISAGRAPAEVITIRTGQIGGGPGLCPGADDSFHYYQPNSTCGQPILPTAFTGTDFDAACAGPQAAVLNKYPSWVAGLPLDSQARWIGHQEQDCQGRTPRSVLYCSPFTVESDCPIADSIRVYWAVDDFLGDPVGDGPNLDGLYVNGVSLGSDFRGGHYPSATAVARNVRLRTGINNLQVYQRDGVNCVASGLLLSATIYVRSPPNIVSNGDFSAGNVPGSMPSPGAVTDWTRLTGSPQVQTIGCTAPGSVAMWGNLRVGESLKQQLPGAGFQVGRTYSVSVCYRWLNENPLLPNHVRFRLTASTTTPAAYPPLSTTYRLIGVTPDWYVEPWGTYTFPNWTADYNYPWLTINPENEYDTTDGAFVSWGFIDDICIVDVTEPVGDYRVVHIEPGTRFQDGFGQSPTGALSTTDPGNSDVSLDLRHGNNLGEPAHLGDSLVVHGEMPINSASRYEAKLWFRLKRTGCDQYSNQRFLHWKNVVAANKGDFYTGPNPNFAWGYMDSVEISTTPSAQPNKFCSQFRESSPAPGLAPEPCFNWEGGFPSDMGPKNAILPDLVFVPGTKIEYFITTNLVNTPAVSLVYPDTTGRCFQEFEILPSFRMVQDGCKLPCEGGLYVDAFNDGAQFYIEHAMNAVFNGALASDPIPDPTTWDRYDYLDASADWKGPLHRQYGGNSGATIPQLLYYRNIMVSTGTAGLGTMWPRDWQAFEQWLTTDLIDGNVHLQSLIVNGTSAANIIKHDYPSLLSNIMGATLAGSSLSDPNDCVDLVPTSGAAFVAGIPIDVFGNVGPPPIPFSVLGTTGTGVGNKNYESGTGGTTSFAQVVNDQSYSHSKYRSIIDGFSYHLLVEPDDCPGNLVSGECGHSVLDADFAPRVTAVYNELDAAIRWTRGGTKSATQTALCGLPIVDATGVPNREGATSAVNGLDQNRPNPFNPRTTIRFSLAADGPAKLVIYDVNGRRIRTLVEKELKAGTHEMIWDGTDDAGQTVTSGVYWSQMQAGTYSSNRKMVVLK